MIVVELLQLPPVRAKLVFSQDCLINDQTGNIDHIEFAQGSAQASELLLLAHFLHDF